MPSGWYSGDIKEQQNQIPALRLHDISRLVKYPRDNTVTLRLSLQQHNRLLVDEGFESSNHQQWPENLLLGADG